MAREPTANDDGKPAVRKILRSRFIPIPCCKSYEIVSRDKKRKKKKRKKDRKRIALQLPRSAKTRKKPRLGKKRRAPRFDFVVARREINHHEIKVGHGFTADIFRGNAVFLSRGIGIKITGEYNFG